MKFMIYILFFSFASLAQSEERLVFLDVFRKVPETSLYTFKQSFSKEAIPGWAAVIGSTAILYNYDENIYAWAQKTGRNSGIGNEDNTRPILKASDYDLIRVPSDTGSALYFLGDGWTHIMIAGSIMGYGYAKDRTREVNTGMILMHGILVSTIFNQTLKRSFGRESPNVKTSERGAWNLFPNFNEYNNRTGSYDAMPSGHVMTATLTFTILAERYPEQKVPLYTVGGVWITALMFQMMNNGVHWASDYPLGIAMGWVIGKASTKIVSNPKDEKANEMAWNFYPIPTRGGTAFMGSRSF